MAMRKSTLIRILVFAQQSKEMPSAKLIDEMAQLHRVPEGGGHTDAAAYPIIGQRK